MNQPNLPAGPELDRLACEALTRAGCAGWEPKIEWWISNDGGHSLAIGFEMEEQALAYLDNPNHPHRSDGYEAVKKERFPRISRDWREAGRALEAMRELGWLGKLGALLDSWVCTLMPIRDMRPMASIYQEAGDTGPHAIALAIVAALEAPCE